MRVLGDPPPWPMRAVFAALREDVANRDPRERQKWDAQHAATCLYRTSEEVTH